LPSWGAAVLRPYNFSAHRGDFEARLTHSQLLSKRQPVHVQAGGGDVLADDSGTEFHQLQRFVV
jgi:hypothetical protein